MEEEEIICGHCAGSGEGYADGSTCQHCKGRGILPSEAEMEAMEKAEDEYWQLKLDLLRGK